MENKKAGLWSQVGKMEEVFFSSRSFLTIGKNNNNNNNIRRNNVSIIYIINLPRIQVQTLFIVIFICIARQLPVMINHTIQTGPAPSWVKPGVSDWNRNLKSLFYM